MAVSSAGRGKQQNTACPLQEYPRPQLVRDSYLCLNGPWEYAVTAEEVRPSAWAGTITVPFSPESPLSGVEKTLLPGQFLWYKRVLYFPSGFRRERVLLHFGAVDQHCTLYINGQEAARHSGGFWPFSADVTKYLTAGANTPQEIVLCCTDDTDTAPIARGRQRLEHGGTNHAAQSGVWQTVWMESVPKKYISGITITPLCDENAVELLVESRGGMMTGRLQVFAHRTCAADVEFRTGSPVRINLPGYLSWSPRRPFLYDVAVTAGQDAVTSYFGMRKISVERDAGGTPRLMLNGRPFFVCGVVDQGWHAEGMLTAPTDKAMENDIRFAKECGFNAIRKHGKIEPLRWYHHCDKLGMLVWQDLPAGGGDLKPTLWERLFGYKPNRDDSRHDRFGREDEAGRNIFWDEMKATADLLANTPSVVVWGLFQNGQGQFEAARLAKQMRRWDPSRLVDHASGRFDQGGGQIKSLHFYDYKNGPPAPETLKDEKRALFITETGGFGLVPNGHFFGQNPHAIQTFEGPRAFVAAVTTLYQNYLYPLAGGEMSGFFLYQLADAEDEVSGLQSADRQVKKLGARGLEMLNALVQGQAEGR